MPYYDGTKVDVYISTEDPDYGISQSGGDMEAVDWTDSSLISHFAVPPLNTETEWDGTEADVTGSAPARATAIMDVRGVEFNVDKEREDIDYLGRKITDHIKIRKAAEVTINRSTEGNSWAILYDKADAGVTGSGGGQAVNESTDQTTTNSGFRVYMNFSAGTGSGHLWYSFRNCTFVSHAVTPTPARVTVEALTFTTNLYDISTVPATASTTEAEL